MNKDQRETALNNLTSIDDYIKCIELISSYMEKASMVEIKACTETLQILLEGLNNHMYLYKRLAIHK